MVSPATGVALAWFEGPLPPSAFRACTSKVYAVSLVSPDDTVKLPAFVSSAALSGMSCQAPNAPVVFRRYWCEVTALPPSDPAVHLSVTDLSPASAVRPVGASGAVAGVALPLMAIFTMPTDELQAPLSELLW